nr:hypothetical protein [uncultured Mediterraneibacter sp.]
MKVYIVTEGEYSDYHIVGVFATREAAEKYCAVHGNYSVYGDPINIEEYELQDGSNIQCDKVYRYIKFELQDVFKLDSSDEIFVKIDYSVVYEIGLSAKHIPLNIKCKVYYHDRKRKFVTYSGTIPINSHIEDPEKIKKIIYDHVAKYKAYNIEKTED